MAGWFSPQGKEVLTKFKPFYIWEGGKLVIPMDLRVGYSYDSHKELILVDKKGRMIFTSRYGGFQKDWNPNLPLGLPTEFVIRKCLRVIVPMKGCTWCLSNKYIL